MKHAAAVTLALLLVACGDSGSGTGQAPQAVPPSDPPTVLPTSPPVAVAPATDSGSPPVAPPAADASSPADSGVADASASSDGGQATSSAQGCVAPTQNPTSGNACHGSPPAPLRLTEVASGLRQPVLVTHAPGDPSRLFVVQRGGVVRLIKDGNLSAEPFLDLSSVVNTSGIPGERGLLGLAFDPNYSSSRRFWVNYTARGGLGDTTIVRYDAADDGDTALPSSADVLLTVEQASALGNHNGGMLAFGPDGCLYVGMGDGGGGDDPDDHGQNDNTPLGAMLRVDVQNSSPTSGAPGNMLGHPHVWSYGLRNPWRFSFDRETGDMYIGDVGQGEWEEVNVEPRGVGGRNYGWREVEGQECRPGVNCNPSEYTSPVAVQPNQSTQNQSVIGGYVYRGSAIPSLVGRYLYADYNSRKIWSFTWQGDGDDICDEVELTDQLTTGGTISSFGEDATGELYIVVYDRGIIYRIDPA